MWYLQFFSMLGAAHSGAWRFISWTPYMSSPSSGGIAGWCWKEGIMQDASGTGVDSGCVGDYCRANIVGIGMAN